MMMMKNLECMTDKRLRYMVHPTRIVWQDAGNGKIDSVENLLVDGFDFCTLSNRETGSGPALVLDFGREINGGVCLIVHMISSQGRAKFHLRFGESVSEVMGQPNTDHAYHDIILNVPQMSTQEFGLTGFRFLRLDLLEANSSVQIRQVRAVALERPWTCLGEFECSDPLLNDIQRTCARTVHLCAQDYMLDGIKRDRLVWMGDIHPQVQVVARVFGEMELVKESLDYLRDQPTDNGWINTISSYSLWWIISQWDTFMMTGDREYLAQQNSYLNNLVDLLSSRWDNKDDWRFIDWASVGNNAAVEQGLAALLIWALRDASAIAHVMGDSALEQRCAKLIEANSPKTSQSNFANKQAGAISVLAGAADAKSTNTYLADDPCKGLSPWCGYYVLNARGKANDVQGGLDLIRKYWGGMLSLGATSIWEHFDVAWLKDAGRIDEVTPAGKHDVHAEYGDHCYVGLRHSLCHGWGGGPAAWLSEYVLGLKIVEPGMKKIAIQPNLGDLSFAKGSLPTPFGLVRVSHRKKSDGTIKTEYELPDGVSLATGE
jgi:hypothetical protein